MTEYVLRAYHPVDLERLNVQPAQAEDVTGLEVTPPAWTFLADDEIVGICGAAPMAGNRAHLWSRMSADAGKHMVAAHRMGLQICERLEATGVERIEAFTLKGFEQGERWLKMLGFEMEAPVMRKFYRGKDYSLWARVR